MGGGLALEEFAASIKSRSLAALCLGAADQDAEEGREGGEGIEGGVGAAGGAGTAHATSDQKVGMQVACETGHRFIGSGEGADPGADSEAGRSLNKGGRGGSAMNGLYV